jgi:hypothetical protein
MSNLKIFIDDWRQPYQKYGSNDWTVCRTYNEFKELTESLIDENKQWIKEISFDYDLSLTDRDYTGTDCFKQLIRCCLSYGLDMPVIKVHSEYPNIIEKFRAIIYSYNLRTDQDIEVRLVLTQDN